jgi:hypothetical protein
MNDHTETHPSYGQLEISRVTSSHRVPLYGTSNQCREYITLTIHRSELHRNLHHNWHHSAEPIIQVAMSPAQFAQAITSLNLGSGTPVTIERICADGKCTQIDPPPYKHDRDIFNKEFEEDIRELQEKTDGMVERVKKMAEGKTINKRELTGIIKELEMIQQDINSNIPFMATSFNEHLEKSISSAKIEIDAFIDSKIRQTGIEALRNAAPVVGEITDKGKSS